MSEPKQRHGCLTAWLILMIVFNGLGAVMNLAMSDAITKQYPDAPGWALPAMAALSVVNVVFAIALFSWKRWGFWGFCVAALVALVINFQMGVVGPAAILGLAGPVILFAVLQIGGANKGWTQLE